MDPASSFSGRISDGLPLQALHGPPASACHQQGAPISCTSLHLLVLAAHMLMTGQLEMIIQAFEGPLHAVALPMPCSCSDHAVLLMCRTSIQPSSEASNIGTHLPQHFFLASTRCYRTSKPRRLWWWRLHMQRCSCSSRFAATGVKGTRRTCRH